MTFAIESHRSLYPFRSNYLEVQGHRYHYIDEGEGPWVVMLHGNPTWSFYYRELVKKLSPQYRVIVPDHIGCGLSDKPGDKDYSYRLQSRVENLEALLQHLGAEKDITLVVHDWGGMIGMTYAVRNSEKIKRLVILNTSAFLMPKGKKLPWRLWLIRQILPFATVAVRGFNVFSGFATFMATKKGLAPEIKRGLVAPYNSWKNRIATLRFVQDIPIYPKDPSYALAKETDDKVAKLFQKTPMLICWGMHDFVFDRDYFAEWKRRFPEAEAHAFEDSGHYILEDSASEVTQLVEDFLEKNPLEKKE